LRNDQVLDYESFKEALRFRLSHDLTDVRMARDFTPWIAGGLATAGLSAAAITYLKSKKSSPIFRHEDNEVKSREVSRPAAPKTHQWPALFRNAGNSCYFHAAMQMIYQMKDWFMHTQPAANNVDARQFKPKYEGQKDPLAFMGHTTEILDELKGLITKMELFERLERQDFEVTYHNVTKLFLPNDPSGQQEDSNDFLVKVFQCIEDVSAIWIRRHATKLISKNLLPWTCGDRQIPTHVIEEFYRTNPSESISNYTFDSSQIEIRLKADGECSLKTPAIVEQDIDGQDVDRQEIDEKPAIILNVHPQKQLCNFVETFFWPHTEFITCINNPIHERMPVACNKIVSQTASTYLIVHVTFDPQQCKSNFPVDWCVDITIHDRPYDLICVIYKTGCRDGGHYTASLKIDGEWKLYDDTARNVRSIGGPGDTKGLPLMLLFKRR
jgi:hypothetical protein